MADDQAPPPAAVRSQYASGLDETLEFRLVTVTTEQVVLEYDVRPKHFQPYGIVHGGVHCAAIETACSAGAGFNALGRGQAVVGVENHTSFVRAVRSGRIRVTATPLTRGRRSQLWEATARNEAGEIVSTGRVRLLCLEPGSELAGQTVDRRVRS
ncbi:MAG: PaaI family thioesterase [Deltaproteobacteria bacterium]|nr:MAG: PaaI family thioesterase [Deltaproteobacteria bacterium]